MKRITSALKGNQLRSDYPLTNDQIMAVAPSVFAEHKYIECTEKYQYIPTITVLEKLRDEGFEPFFVAQARNRKEDRAGFARHMLRLRQAGVVSNDGVTDEIVLIHSHDRTSSLIEMAGQYRMVCANGCIAGSTFSEVRVQHRGHNVLDDAIEGTFTVVKQFEQVAESRELMRSLTLNRGEQLAFAKAALELKYPPREVEEGVFVPVDKPIEPQQLLTIRRNEDRSPDLFSTFNVIQENLLKGGLPAKTANGRRSTTRKVNGITEDVRLNRGLWTLADELRKLKA